MKKLLMLVGLLFLTLGRVIAAEPITGTPEAVKRLYDNGLTKYSTLNEYSPNTFLTREQGAKFFSLYAKNVEQKQLDDSKSCIFSDIDEADATLKDFIIESCKLGIFQGSKGKFMPKQKLTKAEATAVLMRIIVGKLDESYKDEWYSTYLSAASDKGINVGADSMGLNPDFSYESFTRGEIAILIYMAGAVNKIDTSSWNTYSDRDLDITFKYPADYKTIKERVNDSCYVYTLSNASYSIKFDSVLGCGYSGISPVAEPTQLVPINFGFGGGEYKDNFAPITMSYYKTTADDIITQWMGGMFYYYTKDSLPEGKSIYYTVMNNNNFDDIIIDNFIQKSDNGFTTLYNNYYKSLDEMKVVYRILESFKGSIAN